MAVILKKQGSSACHACDLCYQNLILAQPCFGRVRSATPKRLPYGALYRAPAQCAEVLCYSLPLRALSAFARSAFESLLTDHSSASKTLCLAVPRA